MKNDFLNGLDYTWLPYEKMKGAAMPSLVSSAKGSVILLEDGTELVDGLSNWWTACHGHGHDYINEKCIEQIKKFPNISFCGLASRETFSFTSRLVNLLHDNLNHVFLSDSGSTAVEVAMRLAFQYYKNIGLSGKQRFIFFRNAYHGDTAGCLSVSDPAAIHGKQVCSYMPHNFMFDIEDVFSPEFESGVSEVSNSVAAFIIEPIVQAAGGMKFYDQSVLKKIKELATKYNILLILDEVAVGFSRIGRSVFVYEQALVAPDILVLGKAVTGGFCSLGVTVVSERVYDAFYSDNPDHVFTYGSTFMGYPVACAAANASLDLFRENGYYLNVISQMEKLMTEEFCELSKLNSVVDVRIKGALAVIEMKNAVDTVLFKEYCIKYGVWMRPLGNIIYIMPAYNIPEDSLNVLVKAVKSIVSLLDEK